MFARIVLKSIVAAGLASLLGAAVVSADSKAFRFTYPEAGSQSDAVLGPGAARNLNIRINGGIDARDRYGRAEGIPLEIQQVTFLGQSAPDCKEPTLSSKGDAVGVEWESDCVVPGNYVDLCIRANLPIFSVDAFYADQFNQFLTYAMITDLPDACPEINCSNAVATVPYVWPPNHKLTPVTISGITGGVGEFTIVATGITQDEELNDRGDGQSCPDGAIESGFAWVRMERQSNGNGRVYVVSFDATDASGASCSGQVSVCVPHSRSGTCVDDGQTVNSMGACGSNMSSASLDEVKIASGMSVRAAAGVARMAFSLPSASRVDIGLFDVAGRRVKLLDSGERAAGAHHVSWDVSSLARGVYFVRMRAGDTMVSKTLLIAD